MAALGWRGQYLRYRELFLNVWSIYKRRQDLKAFMEILFSLSTISVFSLFALKPTLLTIAALIKDNQAKETSVANMDEKIRNLGIAQGILSSSLANINLIESAVPGSALPETFVRQIEGLASSHAVSLLGISIGEVTILGPEVPKAAKEQLEKLPEDAKDLDFNVSVSGTYQNLLGFVSDIENFRRPVKIDIFNFNLSSTEIGKTLVLVISGRTPYLGQEETANK